MAHNEEMVLTILNGQWCYTASMEKEGRAKEKEILKDCSWETVAACWLVLTVNLTEPKLT